MAAGGALAEPKRIDTFETASDSVIVGLSRCIEVAFRFIVCCFGRHLAWPPVDARLNPRLAGGSMVFILSDMSGTGVLNL